LTDFSDKIMRKNMKFQDMAALIVSHHALTAAPHLFKNGGGVAGEAP
jgi:hypothetical protein